MLPFLYDEYQEKPLDANLLMGNYIDHMIDRQLEKSIVSAVKENKKEVIIQFYQSLAVAFFLKKITLTSSDIICFLESKIEELKLYGKELKEGFENEILTGYFLQRNGDEFKFVHKSFYEYFVSLEIISKLKSKNFDNNLILSSDWTDGMQYFVYEGSKGVFKENSEIPSLLIFTNKKYKAIFKNFSFKLISNLYSNIFRLEYYCSKIFRYANKKGNTSINVLRTSFFICLIFIFGSLIYIDTNIWLDLFIASFCLFIMLFLFTIIGYLQWHIDIDKKLDKLERFSTNISNFILSTHLLVLVIGTIFISMLVKNLLYGILILLISFSISIILTILVNKVVASPSLNFLAKAFSFSINNGELKKNNTNFKIFHFLDTVLSKHFHKIEGFDLSISHYYYTFYQLECVNLRIKGKNVSFSDCTIKNLILHGIYEEIIFLDCNLDNINLNDIDVQKDNFQLILNTSKNNIDSITLNSIVNLYKDKLDNDLSSLTCPDWLGQEIESLLK